MKASLTQFLSRVKWELHLSLRMKPRSLGSGLDSCYSMVRARGVVGSCCWEQKGDSREPLLWESHHQDLGRGMECTFSTSADDPKLSAAVDMPEGQDATQMDLDKLEVGPLGM